MIKNLNLTEKQSQLFLNSIKSLDELAMEMAVVSDKTGDIAVALAGWSESIAKLHTFLTTPEQEYIDKYLKSGAWMRGLLAETPVIDINVPASEWRFELRKYVVIKCEGKTAKSVSFSHVGAHSPVVYKNKNFKDGVTIESFKKGSYYVVYASELRSRVYCWHWAQEVEMNRAIFINNNLKTAVKQLIQGGY